MSDIGDILAKRKIPDEPPEFSIIRGFVQKEFDVTPQLQIRDNAIMIKVPGSVAAGALRFRLHELQDLLPKKSTLVIVSF